VKRPASRKKKQKQKRVASLPEYPADVIARTKIPCAVCRMKLPTAKMRAHFEEFHRGTMAPSTDALRLAAACIIEQISKPQTLASRIKEQGVKSGTTEPPAQILCRWCNSLVPKGQLKQHRVDMHNQSDAILESRGRLYGARSSSGSKQGRTQFAYNNLGRPWQGGSPG